MVRRNPNEWRRGLDPRDPDYDDPPEVSACEGDTSEDLPDPMEEPYDYEGPWNYVPCGDH